MGDNGGLLAARARRAALGMLAALSASFLLAACTGGGSAPSPSPTWTAPAVDTSLSRCPAAPAELKTFVLKAGDASLPAATLGDSATVAVLLHQTNGGGACGWLPAAQLFAQRGIRPLLFDVYGFGPGPRIDGRAPDAATQVDAAVAWAKKHGATRVVLVGASMGGAIAVGTAQDSGADAVVDLSGPMAWSGVPGLAEAAPALTLPTLVSAAPDDTTSPAAALGPAAGTLAGPHLFVTAPTGHGYELLLQGDGAATPFFDTVVNWVLGSYPAGVTG